eukprot:9548530-Lingulodinium_polyedra.AAC.1
MARKKFDDLSHGLLVASGMEFAQVKRYAFYALRRFPPTVADVLQFSGKDAQAIGNWQDIP